MDAPETIALYDSPRGPRSAMRQRIIALLATHPEGLTPREVQHLLRVEQPLGKTMKAMARDGWLTRVERGRYTSVNATPKEDERD